MQAFRKLIRDNRGVGAIEYALVASLISVAAVTAFGILGREVQNKYELVDQKLGDAIE